MEQANSTASSRDEDGNYDTKTKQSRNLHPDADGHSQGQSIDVEANSAVTVADEPAPTVGFGALGNTESKSSWKSFSPARIRFSQDSISNKFQDGDDVNLTILDIAAGKQTASSVVKINVVEMSDGVIISADNRRLYVFRVLNLMGILDKIEVNVISCLRRDETTTNSGCHVTMRRGQGYRHCYCNGSYQSLPGWWDRRLLSVVRGRLKPYERASLDRDPFDDITCISS